MATRQTPPLVTGHLAEDDGPRQPLLPLVATIAAIAVAALAGWVLGGMLTRKPAAPQVSAPRAATVGPLKLELDGTWSTIAASAPLTGMQLQDLAVYAPVAGVPARTWVARAPADGPSLVPASVRDRLDGRLASPARTVLGGRPAWTYPATALRSGGRLELTVQPTAAGVLLVGCEADQSWWSTVAGCARSIRDVSGAATFAPAADISLRQALKRVVVSLNAARAGAGKALQRARTPRGQQLAAQRLAKAHAAAAARLSPLAGPAGSGRTLVARLGAAAAAYRGLATAAGRRSRPAYRSARASVGRAEGALRIALRRAAP
jgi:hypothetical protein